MTDRIMHYRTADGDTVCPACYPKMPVEDRVGTRQVTTADGEPYRTCDACGAEDPDFVAARNAHEWMGQAVRHDTPWNADIARDAGRTYHG